VPLLVVERFSLLCFGSRYTKMETGPEAPSGLEKDKFIGTVDLEMEHRVELFNKYVIILQFFF
jgi:hypothetical protein